MPTLLHTTRGVSDQCIWRRAEYAVNLLHQEENEVEVEKSAYIGLASSAFLVLCAEESNTLLTYYVCWRELGYSILPLL